jgi:hypothetical protein
VQHSFGLILFNIDLLLILEVASRVANEIFASALSRLPFAWPCRHQTNERSNQSSSLAFAADRKLVMQAERRAADQKEVLLKKWESAFENLTAKKDTPMNPNGKARTFEENKMVLLALRGCVRWHLKMVNLGMQDTVNWRAIDLEMASAFGVKQQRVMELRQQF